MVFLWHQTYQWNPCWHSQVTSSDPLFSAAFPSWKLAQWGEQKGWWSKKSIEDNRRKGGTDEAQIKVSSEEWRNIFKTDLSELWCEKMEALCITFLQRLSFHTHKPEITVSASSSFCLSAYYWKLQPGGSHSTFFMLYSHSLPITSTVGRTRTTHFSICWIYYFILTSSSSISISSSSSS